MAHATDMPRASHRVSRATFVLGSAILILAAALSISAPLAWALLLPLAAWLAVYRLHDLGRSAFWVLAPVAWYVVWMLLLWLASSHGLLDPAGPPPPPPMPDYRLPPVEILLAAIALLAIPQLGFFAWLAAAPGVAGDNRYGAPPPRFGLPLGPRSVTVADDYARWLR